MKKRTKILIGLCLFQLIILLPIMIAPAKLGHDMTFHLANVELLSQYLNFDMWKQGFHIMPDMIGNLGYGIGIFYPILPHLICAIVAWIYHWFQIPTLYAIYTVFFAISYGSSILVYMLAKKIHKNDLVAILSALIYTTMPYFLSNFFIRFALNEIMCIFFFLMVLLSLFYLIEKNQKLFYFFFILGYIGMISSHLTLTIFATGIFFVFTIIYRNELLTKTNLKRLFIAIGIVSIWVLPDVVLLLIHQLDGNYTVFLDNVMTSLGLVNSERLTWQQFLTNSTSLDWNIAYYIPLYIILLFIISMIIFFRKKEKILIKPILFYSIITLITFILMTPLFSWQFVPKLLLMIQFPWRLESFLLLSISILAPIMVLYFKEKDQKKVSFIILLALFISTIPLLFQLKNRIYLLSDYTKDDGLGHQQEYLPAYFDKENLLSDIESSSSVATIKKNKADQLVFEVSYINGKDVFTLPKLFYYGYELTDQDGNYYSLKRSNDGYLQVTLEKEGTYELRYTGTIAYQILRLLRISMVLVAILYTVIYFKRK